MTQVSLNENTVEEAALDWMVDLGYEKINGPEMAPDGDNPERNSYEDVVLKRRLEAALARLNPNRSHDALNEALRKIFSASSPSVLVNNREFHRYLVGGVPVEAQKSDGTSDAGPVNIIDLDNIDANDFLAVNQFTVIEGRANRRPDVVVFINGLPIAVLELKDPKNEDATIKNAFNQLLTYKKDIPSLFIFNEILILSDGLEAFVGSLTSNLERFMAWKTIDGDKLASPSQIKLEVLIKGLFEKRRLLGFLKSFITFEDDGRGDLSKKIAGYHQFHAVKKAIDSTVRVSRPGGDHRAGVVWHTQGSGKSLTMAFYAGLLIQAPTMNNPTLIVLTDRNDLDKQLFETFSRNKDLLRQTPQNAETRDDLKKLLQVSSGGVIFTTIQKFLPETRGKKFPLLSDRHNIVVIADEAHRSQYGFKAKADAKAGTINVGFAQHLRDALPNASFIGFTGTPIELTDKSTRQVFGEYIDIYDIQQAVEDKATVQIFYESRLAKLQLKEDQRPHLDDTFEEVTEGEEEYTKEKLKTKWAQLEAIVGSETRVKEIAEDIVSHFQKRQEAMDGGKAMIVCMSRRICVGLYDELIKLKPEWHSTDDAKGNLKVVMTGAASDPQHYQPHVRNKARCDELATRFRKPDDPFQLVIVRDMWLTGFDAPCLHTLYVDKPMRGHGLMQAIARVNRVFKDKDGGLVVDYLGIADQLKEALHVYTQSGGRGQTHFDIEQAVEVLEEKHEVVCQMFHDFDWSIWHTGTPRQRLALLPGAQEHILKQRDGKKRFVEAVTELAKAYSLTASHERAIAIRDDIAFFQVIRSILTKGTGIGSKTQDDMEFALRQLVSSAVSSGGVVDVFAAAGLDKPNISVLSDEFLSDIRKMPHKNLAVELLARLLKGEIKTRWKKNVVQARSFAELIEGSLRKYQNRAIETAQIIEELIGIAKDISAAKKRGEELHLNDDELAFYDALEVNDSAVKVLGDDTLQTIARELVKSVKANVTIDWAVRESARAQLRVIVKRLLKKYGYPPDKQEKAIQTVLQQAELLCQDWAM